MKSISRRVSAAVNPVSTAVTRWWCYSAARHLLTGHGPTARQRRLIRAEARVRRVGHGPGDVGYMPSGVQMKAREQAIGDLMASLPRSAGEPPEG